MRKYERLTNERLIECVKNMEELVDNENFAESPFFDDGVTMLYELKEEAFVRFALIIEACKEGVLQNG